MNANVLLQKIMGCHIEIFTVCDAATIRNGFNIVGTYNTINADSYPVDHDFVVAVAVGFDVDDTGLHEIRVSLLDPDGQNVLPPYEIDYTIHGIQSIAPVSENIWRFSARLPKFGDYMFQLRCDQKMIGEKTIYFQERE